MESKIENILSICNKDEISSLKNLLNKCSQYTLEQILKDLEFIPREPHIPKSDILYIFSDGNCKFNGNRSGKSKSAYSIFFKDPILDKKYSKTENVNHHSVDTQTNNQAELSGILEIFSVLFNHSEEFRQYRQIVICTDSKYSIDCIQKWAKNWIKNGWKTSKGEQVKNRKLIEEILQYKTNCNLNITFQHVLGHQPEPKDINSLEYLLWEGNMRVDTNINKFLEEFN